MVVARNARTVCCMASGCEVRGAVWGRPVGPCVVSNAARPSRRWSLAEGSERYARRYTVAQVPHIGPQASC